MQKAVKKIMIVIMVFSMTLINCYLFSSSQALQKNDDVKRYTVLVLDTSDSLTFSSEGVYIYTANTAINYVKSASCQFLKNIGSAPGYNYVAVVSCSGFANKVSDFSFDNIYLTNKINSLSASGSYPNIAEGLDMAYSILSAISNDNTIKNVVLFTTGLTSAGEYNYTGHFDSSVVGSSWKRLDNNVHLYAYANAAYEKAQYLKNSGTNVYTIGLFQTMNSIPEAGKTVAELFKLTTKDLASSEEYYYEVDDVNNLEFTFGEIADEILNDAYPIIIIPGIMGSNLYKDQNGHSIVWAPTAIGAIWNAFSWDAIADDIEYGNTLYTINHYDNQVNLSPRDQESAWETGTREYGAQNRYKSLVDGLCARFPDREIYFFSYDFRKSTADSAQDLARFITEKKIKKADIIAHSMGGLVAANYMLSDVNRQTVDKIITCGTPYEGAPKLFNSVLNWELLATKDERADTDGFKDMISDNILGLAGLRKAVKAGFPSTAELCPTKQYYDKYCCYYSETVNGLFGSSTQYKTIDYNEYKDIGKKIFGSSFDNALIVQNTMKTNGYNILTTLNNTYFVVGINQPTINSIVFNNGDSLDSIRCENLEYEYEYGNRGDGTVPYYSATAAQRLDSLEGKENRVLKVSANHGGTCSTSTALNWIYDIIDSGTSSISSDIQKHKSYVVVKIACPVDVTIENNGELLCSDTQKLSVESSFGRLDFLGNNDDVKMLCLDNDEVLPILLRGTDRGSMDYEIRWYDENGKIVEKKSFSNVPISNGMLLQTSTNQNDTYLHVDLNGDGETDSTIHPDTESLRINTVESAIYRKPFEASLSGNNIPIGSRIEWTSDNSKVQLDPSEDKSTCAITSNYKGTITLKAIAYSESNEKLAETSVTIQIKYTWWQILIRIVLLGFLWY